MTDGKNDNGVPEHFEEEGELLDHLKRIDEAEGLFKGERTVRVLSKSPNTNKSVGRLLGVTDAANVLEWDEVREEELVNPLQ